MAILGREWDFILNSLKLESWEKIKVGLVNSKLTFKLRTLNDTFNQHILLIAWLLNRQIQLNSQSDYWPSLLARTFNLEFFQNNRWEHVACYIDIFIPRLISKNSKLDVRASKEGQ